MSNASVYVITEGQTEQTFIRDILSPYMAQKGIYLYPTLIGKPGHKGGNISFERAKNDIGNLLKQRKDIYVSTMFDYFRIDVNWPGYIEIQQKSKAKTKLTAIEKAEILEAATLKKISYSFPLYHAANRFIPYIEMHEFEALLFSDAEILSEKAEIDIARIREILHTYNNPEEINDNPDQSPSNRIKALNKGYRKVAMGKTISQAIGIQKMREQCQHFDNWLTKFEKIPCK